MVCAATVITEGGAKSMTVEDVHPGRTPGAGSQADSVAVPTLSPREVEVLLAWFAADSKVEAAASLFITPATVSTHITRIRGKYDLVGRPARTKAQLLARAIQDGYTHLDDW
ncbi:MAG: helix-turn-helix transcriptional regulator [Gordonia sp. (in: high G+C Gram-positive bacteria)]|nr:MAG: helix-turn-helix transcriptional regulator [Gordonia sp. (in: high G+C Gram-positive bacteria)]